jgi:hypothetical protein
MVGENLFISIIADFNKTFLPSDREEKILYEEKFFRHVSLYVQTYELATRATD